MRNPSMRMAEWVYKHLGGLYKETADDVYDVLLGHITSPADFCDEVRYLALEYENEFTRRSN